MAVQALSLIDCFVVMDLVFELRFLYLLWSSFVARPLVLPEGVRVVLGRLPCLMVCLCFCWCFVCLLVGRLVLSFGGVRLFVFLLFVVARVASFESFVCCGGAWGVFFFFLLVSNV